MGLKARERTLLYFTFTLRLNLLGKLNSGDLHEKIPSQLSSIATQSGLSGLRRRQLEQNRDNQ